MCRTSFAFLAILWSAVQLAASFQPHFLIRKPLYQSNVCQFSSNEDNDQGEGDGGPNWIEKSFPVDTKESDGNESVEDYDVGISGESFQTGPLGKRMFDAIMSKMSSEMSGEIKEAYTLYAMDFTAKEATRASLTQNGLEMVLHEEEDEEGMWGEVENIRFYDAQTRISFNTIYKSLEDAVKHWTPGQPFDFVARHVPAKTKELSVEELVEALDPDGSLREEAKSLKGEEDVSPDEEALLSIFNDVAIGSLSELANDNIRRRDSAPREATIEGEAFAGGLSRGYCVIKRSDLLRDSMNPDGTENEKTLMHVMDALVSHGVLLVDLMDGGTTFKAAETLSGMWSTADSFFAGLEDDDDAASKLPGMATIEATGSEHAAAGFATYDNGSMQFLETRTERASGALLPTEAAEVLGEAGVNGMKSAFDVVAQIGKDVVRVATAASSVEHGAFLRPKDTDDRDQRIRASLAATLLADELVDDGKSLPTTAKIEHSEGTVSMSPHRLCRYTEGNADAKKIAREVFGAHTDSSFITAVPVAAISGLEVYDETAEKWYRPELKARAHWQEEQKSRGKDPSSLVYEIDGGVQIPWHARYVVIMPGEHLQIVTRDEISSSVHRVVAAKGSQARLSAPMLLRGRPGTKFSTKRYLGGSLGNPLLEECEGKTMEDIHDLTQTS